MLVVVPSPKYPDSPSDPLIRPSISIIKIFGPRFPATLDSTSGELSPPPNKSIEIQADCENSRTSPKKMAPKRTNRERFGSRFVWSIVRFVIREIISRETLGAAA